MARPRGEHHPSAVLTQGDVDKLRLVRGRMSVRAAAKWMGIGKSQVSRIQRGEKWSDFALDGGPPR